jgi:hypothetical protein
VGKADNWFVGHWVDNFQLDKERKYSPWKEQNLVGIWVLNILPLWQSQI